MKQEEKEHLPCPLLEGEGEQPVPDCAALLITPVPLAGG